MRSQFIVSDCDVYVLVWIIRCVVMERIWISETSTKSELLVMKSMHEW